ncbi:type II CAAX endopeptidase family protein [Streptococcus infantis]|uniref:CPBP family intramembrane glutamic endopeptidase n=1 Tax=Streptococcus infantis TaxID=68892 RepID=UPI0039C362DE
MKKLGHLGVFILLVFLSVYLPELGIMYLTKFLGWGIDGYSIILTMELVLSLFLLVWWLQRKKMLFVFEKKSWNWSTIFYLLACYVVYQVLGRFWERYAHLIDYKNIHDYLYTMVLSNGQPTFLSIVLGFILAVIIGLILEETLDRGYFMNTFFPQSKYYLDVIFSALIFGFSHLILSHRDPISLLYFSFLGFFFALVYRYTSNLRLTILCHCLFNFFNHAKPIWIFVYNFIYYRFFR